MFVYSLRYVFKGYYVKVCFLELVLMICHVFTSSIPEDNIKVSNNCLRGSSNLVTLFLLLIELIKSFLLQIIFFVIELFIT